jgi:hypothetical protein
MMVAFPPKHPSTRSEDSGIGVGFKQPEDVSGHLEVSNEKHQTLRGYRAEGVGHSGKPRWAQYFLVYVPATKSSKYKAL